MIGECKLLLFPEKLQKVPGNQTIQLTKSWSLLSQKRSCCHHFAHPLQASCAEMIVRMLNHWEALLQEITALLWLPMTSLWIMGILSGFQGKMIRAKRNSEFSESLICTSLLKCKAYAQTKGKCRKDPVTGTELIQKSFSCSQSLPFQAFCWSSLCWLGNTRGAIARSNF